MFLTSGYVLIVCVLVESGVLHSFKRDLSQKESDVLKLRLACS